MLAWHQGLSISWGAHEAAAEEIEMRTAKHLALQHLQTVEVAFDGAIAPGQRHPSFDGGIAVAQSVRKTLQGLHRTGRGAGEPAIKALRLAGPHEVGKVPGQRDRLSQLRLLRGELYQLLCLV